MEADFWHQRWKDTKIGFHQNDANHLFVKHFQALCLAPDTRVFLPLCGKTLDIAWLLKNGHRVAGAELSELAVDQLFTELTVEPTITNVGKLKRYSAKNIDIFAGDIFEVTTKMLGPVDAIYDRAALIALPAEMRIRYTRHLTMITRNAPQLLIQLVYDQSLVDGPPFSISDAEIHQHYENHYTVTLLERTDVASGLKGKYPAQENVWLLKNS